MNFDEWLEKQMGEVVSDDSTDVIRSVIADIEYLRAHGCYPWQGASGRRAMERRYTYQRACFISGAMLEMSVQIECSCKYVRYSVKVEHDGVRIARYMSYLRALVK